MDFNRADNCVLQKNYTAGVPRYRLAFRRDRKWTQGCGRKASLFLLLSLSFTQDGNDVHLISHLDNRAIMSRANDVLRGIWRRLGRNGNELFNSLLMRLSYYYVWYFRYHVLPKLQWNVEQENSYIPDKLKFLSHSPIRTLMYAFINDILCMFYWISLHLCIYMRIEKINKCELIELMSEFCLHKLVAFSIGAIWNDRDKTHIYLNVKCKINLYLLYLKKKNVHRRCSYKFA